MNGTPDIDLDYLFDAALNQRAYNQRRLGEQAQRYAASISWQMAPDPPEDLHEEVFTEAFALLFKAGPAALAGMTGKQLFGKAVRKAVRRIQADNTQPGQ